MSLVWLPPTWAQSNVAIVAGDHVFIRRGPGTEFPPFATLDAGSTVEVKEMHGEWTRVVTANGQAGYVNSTFLVLPGERGAVPQGAGTQAPTPPPPSVAPAAKLGTPLPAARPSATRALARPTATPRAPKIPAKIPATLPATATVAPTGTPTALASRTLASPTLASSTRAVMPGGSDTEPLRAELARLTAAVEGLQRRIDAQSPPGQAPPGQSPPGQSPPGQATDMAAPLLNGGAAPAVHISASTAILCGAVGLCIGWLLGSAYGRNQERGRRPRVRL